MIELYYYIYVHLFRTLENIWFTLGLKTSVAQYWNYLNTVLTPQSNEGFLTIFKILASDRAYPQPSESL